MNKKLLLLALPAVLALSGCQAARGMNNQPENKARISEMAEDTLAHDEVFGGAEAAHIFVPKANPSKATLAESSVKVGCQLQFNDKNTESTADDTISIRFLAALTDSNVTAVWHRGLAQPNGYEGAETSNGVWKYKFSGETVTPNLTSNVKYDALNNGGVRIAAGEDGEYENYECFVIYTLMNIPYEQFKDSYLAAYVTLGSNNSQAIAVKIEKDGDLPKNFFSFDPNVTGHFLQGKINNTSNALVYATEQNSALLYASYDNITLKSSDSFGSFYFNPSHFQFFGNSSFFTGASDYFNASSLGGYSSPKSDGTYTLYVCSSSTGAENHIHVKNEVTLYFTANWADWEHPYAYAFINAGTDAHNANWPGVKMDFVGVNTSNQSVFDYTVDLGIFDRLIFNEGSKETVSIDISGAVNADTYSLKEYNDNKVAVNNLGSFPSSSPLSTYRAVYFTNNKNWGNPKFHVFNSETSASEASWPGVAATRISYNEYNQGVYRVLIDTTKYNAFIFNGDNGQTVDILLSTLTGDDNACYCQDSTDNQGHFYVTPYEFEH